MPLKKMPNRWDAPPELRWTPERQSNQTIARLRREIRELRAEVRAEKRPIYREAAIAVLADTRERFKSALEKRRRFNIREAGRGTSEDFDGRS